MREPRPPAKTMPVICSGRITVVRSASTTDVMHLDLAFARMGLR